MCCESRIISYEIRIIIYELLFYKCSLIQLFKNSLTHSQNKFIRSFAKHLLNIYVHYLSFLFFFFFATRAWALKSLFNVVKIVFIRRNRFTLIRKFASTSASRAMRKTKTTKRIEFFVIRKKRKIAFDDVRKRRKKIACNDVVVVFSREQQKSRISSRWRVCDRFRRR